VEVRQAAVTGSCGRVTLVRAGRAQPADVVRRVGRGSPDTDVDARGVPAPFEAARPRG